LNSNQADDKALLKIVNHGDSTFYLESASFTHVEHDGANQAEAGSKLATSTEQMYLVVRSLKHNNEKIDYEIQEKDILKIGRVKFAVKEIGYSSDSQAMEIDSKDQEK